MAGRTGLDVTHHNAESDANGAAKIVLASAALHVATTFPALIETTRIRMGSITAGGYEPCRLPGQCTVKSRGFRQAKTGTNH